MTRIARNLTAIDPDFMRGIRYLILDRDSKFTNKFKTILEEGRPTFWIGINRRSRVLR